VRVSDGRIESELRRLAGPVLEASGLELVEIRLKGSPGKQLVRLDIDRPGAEGVSLSDCQNVSRELGELLDAEDLMPGAYVLEVSSPGIDRPIRSADDVRRNTGRRIVVTVAGPDGKRGSRSGWLLGCENGEMRLRGDDREEVRIALDEVVSARREVAF